MAKYTITLSANTAGTYVCDVNPKRGLPAWYATLSAYGTFGGGTLTWFTSPDSGTTLIPMTDITDAAVTMTTNKQYNTSLSTGSKLKDHDKIYVTLTGATTPSITVTAADNRA